MLVGTCLQELDKCQCSMLTSVQGKAYTMANPKLLSCVEASNKTTQKDHRWLQLLTPYTQLDCITATTVQHSHCLLACLA